MKTVLKIFKILFEFAVFNLPMKPDIFSPSQVHQYQVPYPILVPILVCHLNVYVRV